MIPWYGPPSGGLTHEPEIAVSSTQRLTQRQVVAAVGIARVGEPGYLMANASWSIRPCFAPTADHKTVWPRRPQVISP